LNLAAVDYERFRHDYLAATGEIGHTSIASAVYAPGEVPVVPVRLGIFWQGPLFVLRPQYSVLI
jgi:hypothetical protein